jgi:hypothetical protein
MTEGASYRLQRRAEKLSKFWFGLFKNEKVFERGSDVFRDGALTGGGLFKVGTLAPGRICIDRVFLDSVWWDDADAVNGNPRSLYQTIPMAREEVLARWPKAAQWIQQAPQAKSPEGDSGFESQADVITVVEAWHLPSSPDSKDGVHAIVLENHVLEVEAYTFPGFPFAWFIYGTAPPKGILPIGLAERLAGIQVSINQHLDTIESSLRLMAVPRVYIDSMSGVSVDQINNAIGAIIHYEHGSNPPLIDKSSPIAQEVFQHLYWLIDAGFEIGGVSRLSATATKPEGLNSGAALREYKDIEAVSFSTVQRNYEDTFLQLATVCTWFAKSLYSAGTDISVKVPGHRFLSCIKWSDVDMEDDLYSMQVFPTSMLPNQPAARYAQIDEWVQRGWVPKEEAMMLMDMPDLDRANSLYTAAVEDIEITIENLLTGEASPAEEAEWAGRSTEDRRVLAAQAVYRQNQPDPLQNLALGIRKVRAQWLLSRHQSDVDENRLQLLLDWIRQAEELLQVEEAAAGAAAAAGGQAQIAGPSSGSMMGAGVPPTGAMMGGVAPPSL